MNVATSDPQFCYVTTTGRVTGRPHEIEIWFAREEGSDTIYMLSGGGDRSDWVRNIRAGGSVTVRIGDAMRDGAARVIEATSEEDALARKLLEDKYGHTQDLTRWLREALPIAIDLQVGQPLD